MAKRYQNRDKTDVLQDVRVVYKEVYGLIGLVNAVFLFLGGFEGMELHDVEQWVNIVTEIPDIKFFPINNPSIINANKIEVPIER